MTHDLQLFVAPGLRELHLKGNRLKAIPPELSALVNLKHLDLSTNEFQTFPDARCFPPALNSLNMSDNQVRVQ
jgi:Leucine-rich repeat (LRR) protein